MSPLLEAVFGTIEAWRTRISKLVQRLERRRIPTTLDQA
jgi:hypothetical protein